MGDIGKKWNQTVSDFRRSDVGKVFQGGGSALSNAVGINIDINKAADRAIGGPLDSIYRMLHPGKKDTTLTTAPQDALITAIEDENKKKDAAKAAIAAQALSETQSRLNRERKPMMGNKNKTLLTGPAGIPTSMLKPKSTLLGQ